MANLRRLIDLDEIKPICFPSTEMDGLDVVRYLNTLPTVDAVEVVHGRWRQKILVGGFAEEWGYVCSECGCTVSDRSNLGIGRYASKNQRLNYCPNCGVNMMDGDGNG